MVKGYVAYLYNNLSPGGGYELEFEEDLFELFGTEDLSERGLVGKWDSQLDDFKSARWNWGTSSLKGFTGMLYLLRCLEDKSEFEYFEFEDFYENDVKHKTNILQKLRDRNLIEMPFFMIYTLRYRDFYFPTLLLRIKRIEWNRDEHPTYPIYITFVPETYFVVGSQIWKELDKRCRSKKYWTDHFQRKYGIKPTKEIEKVLSSYTFTQNLYRLMPISLLERKFIPEMGMEHEGILYLKDVERGARRRERELSFTDNQIFWGLFHYITNTKQQLFTPELRINDERFQIKNIPINTLSNRTDVFRQEAGVANTLCHILFDNFGRKYLEAEFGERRAVGASETSILRRAVKLKEVSDSPKERFKNTNFDYGVFLEPLGAEYSILFSLTTALWEKGRGKSYLDYIDQSMEMVFRTPLDMENVKTVWFIAIDDTENSWFSSHKVAEASVQEMVGRITSKLPHIKFEIIGENDFSVKDKQAIVLSAFKKTPQSKNVRRELDNLLSAPRETKFYSVVKSIIENL